MGISNVLKSAMKQPSGGTPTSGAGVQKPPISQKPSSSSAGQRASGVGQKPAGPTASKSETAVKKIPMYIQPIPPFKGGKTKQTSAPVLSTAGVNGATTPVTTATAIASTATPVSPTIAASANKLNVNASSFMPTHKVSCIDCARMPGGTFIKIDFCKQGYPSGRLDAHECRVPKVQDGCRC